MNAQNIGSLISVNDADEVYKSFAHGANTVSEPEDKESGRSCGVTHPFRNIWWVTRLFRRSEGFLKSVWLSLFDG